LHIWDTPDFPYVRHRDEEGIGHIREGNFRDRGGASVPPFIFTASLLHVSFQGGKRFQVEAVVDGSEPGEKTGEPGAGGYGRGV